MSATGSDIPIRIPLSNVSITPGSKRHVLEALERGDVSGTGPQVRAFEATLQDTLGVSHVVAVNSGSSALEVVLMALGVGHGDEVIVPCLTFAAPASAALRVGATPVVVDVDEPTWTIDLELTKTAITSRTRAIIAVDLLGHPCDYTPLAELGLPIVEDAAQAHGARYKGRLTGGFGVAAAFSFHANKAIACGEGGCIATDDANLHDRVTTIVNHGMTSRRPYHHITAGTNRRMPNLVAAFGLGQVECWAHLLQRRQRVAERYHRLLSSTAAEGRPRAHWADCTTWLHAIRTPAAHRVVRACRDVGVDARAIWPPIVDSPAFAAFRTSTYPVSRAVSRETLWLPTWGDMTDEVIAEVCRPVLSVLSGP